MLGRTLVGEFVKLRRSRVTWATLAVMSIGPLAISLFMWIVREPGRAAQLGLLGTKADLSGLEATWPSYVSMLTLVVGVGGMLALSFIVAFLFGREYADGTAKNLLALPVPRAWFVVAKLIVAAAWWVVLVLCVLAESAVIGLALELPGLTPALAARGVRDTLLAAAIAYVLVPVTAWVAVRGRGYMPPLAFAIVMMGLGSVFGKTGWAALFPWSIVPMLIGMVGAPVTSVPPISVVLLGLTSAAGVAATIVEFRRADNTQ